MWVFTLLCLLASAPDPPKAKPVEGTFILEDRSISMPPLPRDGGEGRSRYGEVRRSIQAAQMDLAAALGALDPELVRTEIPAQGLAVPKSRAAQAQALVDILKDPAYARLEKEFLQAWKGWQAALVEGGLAKSNAKPQPTPGDGAESFEKIRSEARQALRGLPPRPLGRDRSSAEFNEEHVDLFPDIQHQLTREQGETIRHSERGIELARRRLTIANRVIPRLAEFWSPLVTHLNLLAHQLAELDQGPQAGGAEHAALRFLRVKTKQAFLERFRRALWYCDLVWSQTAQAVPPTPPGPVSGKTSG